jgi:hypothetical protein
MVWVLQSAIAFSRPLVRSFGIGLDRRHAARVEFSS